MVYKKWSGVIPLICIRIDGLQNIVFPGFQVSSLLELYNEYMLV